MKTVVITGGTRGIGAGLVREFLRAGWQVAYSGTTDKSVEHSLTSLEGRFPREHYAAFRCDVTRMDDIAHLWDQAAEVFGQIDIWINNAGISNERAPFAEVPAEAFSRIIDTNIKGLMMATQLAYTRMREQSSGAIYNMEGLGSDGRTVPGLIPYGTTKRAVRYFSDAFAGEVKGGPVIIGTLSPGMVLTDMLLEPLRKNPEKNKQAARIFNILADDSERVTPFLVKKMIENRVHGAKIRWLTKWKVMKRFLLAPVVRRDVVGKYLE